MVLHRPFELAPFLRTRACNFAISVEACSDGKFIVTSTEEAYPVPTTSLNWKFRLKCRREGSKMRNHFRISLIVLVGALTFFPVAFAQNNSPQHSRAAQDREATA